MLEATGLAERDVPDYIEVDHSKMTAKLTRVPQITDVPYPVQMEPHLVVEYLLALIGRLTKHVVIAGLVSAISIDVARACLPKQIAGTSPAMNDADSG